MVTRAAGLVSFRMPVPPPALATGDPGMMYGVMATQPGKKVGAGLGCLVAAAGLLVWHYGSPRPGANEGSHRQFYMCTDGACGTEYSVLPGEDLRGRDETQCPA